MFSVVIPADGDGIAEGSHDSDQRCQSNYLDVSGLERRCGGPTHVTDVGTDAVDVTRDEVIVEYQFDTGSRHHHLQRGFWLEFHGIVEYHNTIIWNKIVH